MKTRSCSGGQIIPFFHVTGSSMCLKRPANGPTPYSFTLVTVLHLSCHLRLSREWPSILGSSKRSVLGLLISHFPRACYIFSSFPPSHSFPPTSSSSSPFSSFLSPLSILFYASFSSPLFSLPSASPPSYSLPLFCFSMSFTSLPTLAIS